jgi:cytosine/adenosine deaminase-related metal-dependent hydrolase
MYAAAERLTPGDVYDAARMALLEMVLTGITTVGEFHYLHHGADGTPYDDPNLLAREVMRAARDVGIRICLLNTAYARSGFRTPPLARQRRLFTRTLTVTYATRMNFALRLAEKTAAMRGWVAHLIVCALCRLITCAKSSFTRGRITRLCTYTSPSNRRNLRSAVRKRVAHPSNFSTPKDCSIAARR